MNAPMESPALTRFRILHDIVCCPITKTPLRIVDLNGLGSDLAPGEHRRLPAGTVGAFISDAVNRAYPFSARIVSFLDRDALHTRTGSSDPGLTARAQNAGGEVKQSVQEWYDLFGWKKNEQGVYYDTVVFSQIGPVGHGLYELMSHLSILDRLRGGQFVLDAASGAISPPEKLAYSWFYKSRVCVDMSVTALLEADAKLRDWDFCCLADVCKLPFRDETFDGAVSGYTVQHVPESQQAAAVKELYRVLRPAGHLCILTEVAHSELHELFFLLLRAFAKMLKVLGLFRPVQPPPPQTGNERPPLYCVLRPLSWWRNMAAELTDTFSIESLRILTKHEFEWLFGSSDKPAKCLRLLESFLPGLVSRFSPFCVIDLGKPA